MELNDYNLEVVKAITTTHETAFALHPIKDCIFDGEKYYANPEIETDETLYFRTVNLEKGCAMIIEETKQAFIVRARLFANFMSIYLQEVPYKPNYERKYVTEVVSAYLPDDVFYVY